MEDKKHEIVIHFKNGDFHVVNVDKVLNLSKTWDNVLLREVVEAEYPKDKEKPKYGVNTMDFKGISRIEVPEGVTGIDIEDHDIDEINIPSTIEYLWIRGNPKLRGIELPENMKLLSIDALQVKGWKRIKGVKNVAF